MRTNIFSLLKNQKSVVLALWATVVLLFAIPQSTLAETKTIQYNPTSSVGWAGWQRYNSNDTCITLTSDNTPTVTSEGRLRITEKQKAAHYVNFKAIDGAYVGTYSYTAYQASVGK